MPDNKEITIIRNRTTFYDTTLREFAIEHVFERALVKPILTKRGTSTFIRNTKKKETLAEISCLIGALRLPRPTTTFNINVGSSILTRTSFVLLHSLPSLRQSTRAVRNTTIEQNRTVP